MVSAPPAPPRREGGAVAVPMNSQPGEERGQRPGRGWEGRARSFSCSLKPATAGRTPRGGRKPRAGREALVQELPLRKGTLDFSHYRERELRPSAGTVPERARGDGGWRREFLPGKYGSPGGCVPEGSAYVPRLK